MKKLVALHIVFLLIFAHAFAQVSDSAGTGLQEVNINISPADTVDRSPKAVPAKDEVVKEPLVVIPWQEKYSIGSSEITNDSLLRWQVWPHWGEFQANRRNVISFRQGTAGRVDAFHINGYQPREQQVRMEGIILNNPLTGYVNYNLIPHRKIAMAREEFNGTYQSEIKLRDYYIRQPISYLNYDESDYSYRNLEFLVSRNFTDRTNLELSYWDRRDGDFYPNNEVEGSQVVGRLYHHLSERFLVRAFYLRNQFNNNEPFGYAVPNPETFHFDPYASAPLSSNGFSEFTRWDLVSGIYHRKDTSSTENAGFEAILSKNERDLRFIEDTLVWAVNSYGGRLFSNLQFQNLDVQAEIDANHYSAAEHSVITYQSWNVWRAVLDASYSIGETFKLFGKSQTRSRSDGKNDYETGGGFSLGLAEQLHFKSSAFAYSRIPEMQELYWQSVNYSGNPELINEEGISVSGEFNLYLPWGFSVGATGRYKDAENAIYLSADSSFINSGSFNQISGTVYGRFENSLVEIESSVTTQIYEYEDISTPEAVLNNQDNIIWLRNSAFIKGYVFDRAAYLKFGLKTLLSPAYYSARTYNTELNYWQGNSSYDKIPPFIRLDAELSARVRAIMVVMRWENALDGLGQAGYFEAAGFPMPPRRLIVGIRAQFRN